MPTGYRTIKLDHVKLHHHRRNASIFVLAWCIKALSKCITCTFAVITIFTDWLASYILILVNFVPFILHLTFNTYSWDFIQGLEVKLFCRARGELLIQRILFKMFNRAKTCLRLGRTNLYIIFISERFQRQHDLKKK